ncbi:helix-turn-helix domain-containing protein [Microbacterium saperdae]|uniref:helix-turn-helix domain-containing protein n=1 Tax=Microbacterium saperdae TaxID=69368 RepID=UPI00114FF3E3|nr:hypothetical protein GCM10010489_11150 [Microbacterium saperdae]
MARRVTPTWVTREVVSRFGVSASERVVLLCLWDHANGDLESWPSHPTIARETGLSERKTKEAVKVLHRRGFTRRADGRGPDDPPLNDRKAVRWLMVPTPALIDRSLVHPVH